MYSTFIQHSLAFMCDFINEVAEQVSLPSKLSQKMSEEAKGHVEVSPKNGSEEVEQIYFRFDDFFELVIFFFRSAVVYYKSDLIKHV